MIKIMNNYEQCVWFEVYKCDGVHVVRDICAHDNCGWLGANHNLTSS